MKKPDRPAQIATILKTIGTEYPADVSTTLETYIALLEAKQVTVLRKDDHDIVQNPDIPPIWSHRKSVEREQHRRERALKKQNNYGLRKT